jgi:hypothetical protein
MSTGAALTDEEPDPLGRPRASIIWAVISTSTTPATFCSTHSSSVSSEATMFFGSVFFAPRTFTSPRSGRPLRKRALVSSAESRGARRPSRVRAAKSTVLIGGRVPPAAARLLCRACDDSATILCRQLG